MNGPAQAHDRLGGKNPVVIEDKLQEAYALIRSGLTDRKKRLKAGKSALYEALKARSAVLYSSAADTIDSSKRIGWPITCRCHNTRKATG